jgi:hypothetical protein
MRTRAERVASVRRLLAAAERLYQGRARLAPDIARDTGLSLECVELGFGCLEREATDADLGALVDAAGTTAHVHVVLSANVFVAPLRALAVARAAANRVTVRPSPRDPTLAQALVREAADASIALVRDRDLTRVGCTEVHVYGRDATVAAIRASARPGVTVRGHGAGFGVAVVGDAAGLEDAAAHLAEDVVLFDQRGCLSPRVAVVIGAPARAAALADALDRSLASWGARVPRGALHDDERAEAVRWSDTVRFAGRLLGGADHAVGLGAEASPLVVPPGGRHVLVAPAPTWQAAATLWAPFARWVVAVGSDDPDRARRVAPAGARISRLGRMQRPPLDGPVDRR